MNIVVCVKQTLDTAATLTVQDGEISWGDAPMVLNPWDEYAVEEALLTQEKVGGEVTALSLGPEDSQEALKQALAMGCDRAILISDPAFQNADTLVASRAIAAAVGQLEDPGVLYFGRASVDSAAGLLYAQISRLLDWPLLSQVAAISEFESDKVLAERLVPEGRQVVNAPLPAVISVVKEINEPRYPSFMGIRKAAKVEIPVWSSSDLGLDSIPTSSVEWPAIHAPEKTEVACEFIDGDSGEAMGQRLAERLVEEKLV